METQASCVNGSSEKRSKDVDGCGSVVNLLISFIRDEILKSDIRTEIIKPILLYLLYYIIPFVILFILLNFLATIAAVFLVFYFVRKNP